MKGGNRPRLLLLEAVGPYPGARLLDLACGPGELARRLQPHVEPGGEVVGVDLAPRMLEVARQRAPGARFLLMDLERLEFDEASFDGAVCGHGYQFVPDLRRALAEAARVLRPGRVLAASVPVSGPAGHKAEVLDRILDELLPPPPATPDREDTLAVLSDPDAFRRQAVEAGFAAASVDVIGETEVFPDVETLVSRTMGWWSCALRLQNLDRAERERVLAAGLEAARAELGAGPISLENRSLVLVARKGG